MFEGLLQPMHLVVILVIALIVFGPSKISELGKGLGEGIRNFKESVKDNPTEVQPEKKDGEPAVQA
jgi:sec-independent protein translocase protein TatA